MIAPAAVGCKRSLANGQLDARSEVNGWRVFNVEDAAWFVVTRL
jgi:hypothetical protein